MRELTPAVNEECDELTFRRSRVPNVQQRDDFLALLAEGIGWEASSRKVGSTASAFSGLRGRDVAFAKQCVEAERIGREEGLPGIIRRLMIEKILDVGDPNHWKALQLLAEAHLPELEHKRRRNVDLRAPDGLEMRHGALVDYSKLSDEELEELERLHAKGRPDGSQRALPPG